MGMKVLIVGGGGREHAIAACVAKSPKVDKIYCAPGNAGIGQIAECVPIGAMEFDKIVAFAKEQAIDLTIVGMDDPLVGGLVDALEAEGLRAFGPRKNAAILEGSKAFSKDLMKKYDIPTAAYENFDDPKKALEQIIALGCNRILTSGQQPTAESGIPLLKELQEQAAGRIILLAGCGVNEKNIHRIASETGIREFHFSARENIKSGMNYKNESVSMGGTVHIDEYERNVTTARRVMDTIQATNRE